MAGYRGFEAYGLSEYEAGEKLFSDGRVVRLVRGSSGRYYATVRDGYTDYSVGVTPTETDYAEVSCSCARRGNCRHIAAVVLAVDALVGTNGGEVETCPGRNGFSAVCQGYFRSVLNGPETEIAARKLTELSRLRIGEDTVGPSGERCVKATAGSHNERSADTYRLRMTLDAAGFPVRAYCTCGCARDGLLCPHLAALLTAIYPEALAPDIKTDPAAQRMIALAAAEAEVGETEDYVSGLVPELIRTPAGTWRVMAVSETTGYTASAELFQPGARFDGKWTRASERLVRFIRTHAAGAGAAGLTSDNIDEFFELFDRNEVKINGEMCKILREKPCISLRTRQEGVNGCRITFDNCRWEFLATGEKTYLLGAGVLAVSPRRMPDAAAALVRFLSASQDGLVLAQGDVKPFFATVILPARTFFSFTFGREEHRALLPPPLRAMVDIRNEGEGSVFAALRFCYGDVEINAFLPSPYDGAGVFWRDREGERMLMTMLGKFLPERNAVTGERFVRNDEGAVFRFVRDGIPLLETAAEVTVSKAMGKATLREIGTVRLRMDTNGSVVELDVDMEGFTKDELCEILLAVRRGKSFVRFSDGSYAELDGESVAVLRELELGLDVSWEMFREKMKLPLFRMLYLSYLSEHNSRIVAEKSRAFAERLERVERALKKGITVPEGLTEPLRPYQESGFRWMRSIELYGFGGILADDMGLGKTVQTLALLLSTPPEGAEGLPGIVVCPTSLVDNWGAEAARFAPSLSVLTVRGSAEERAEQIRENAAGVGLVITSYDSLKRDAPLYRHMTFRIVVADEAQNIKNRVTQASGAVKSLKSLARFALTGTPVENYPSELWSIFDYLMPGYLGSYNSFKKNFETPISDGNSLAIAWLNRRTAPFVLRRIKKDVLTELPGKTENVLRVSLLPEQKKAYTAVAAALAGLLENHLNDPRLNYADSMTVLTLLLRLRQICCHPPLCMGPGSCSESAKLDMALELTNRLLGEGHRILLFSQFTAMLDCIAECLQRSKVPFFMLTGKTPPAERAELVSRFNGGERDVFLISLKAGGTGLNLTGADTVIHYDPWWNSAAQNQATDRAHRIGQQKPVSVFRLIAADTIEERIAALAEKKSDLADALLSGTTGLSLGTMTPKEILRLIEADS